jgi:hypothetical protein
MRSDLIFGALTHLDTRLQDTTNEVLSRFHTANPASEKLLTSSQAADEQRRAA